MIASDIVEINLIWTHLDQLDIWRYGLCVAGYSLPVCMTPSMAQSHSLPVEGLRLPFPPYS